MGSLANLIAFRLYTSREKGRDSAAFATKFVIWGSLAFLAGIALYFSGSGLE